MYAVYTLHLILHSLGITGRYKGQKQIVYAIELILQDESRLESVIQEIYKPTANHFQCNWTSIEHNIRTIAIHAWQTDPDALAKLAGYPLLYRPSVSEFLEIIASYIRRTQIDSSDSVNQLHL